jgi:hypothetical protein
MSRTSFYASALVESVRARLAGNRRRARLRSAVNLALEVFRKAPKQPPRPNAYALTENAELPYYKNRSLERA